MPTLEITVEEEPHGHGLSVRRGIADGLLEEAQYKDKVPPTHRASYRRGVDLGTELRKQITAIVKP